MVILLQHVGNRVLLVGYGGCGRNVWSCCGQEDGALFVESFDRAPEVLSSRRDLFSQDFSNFVPKICPPPMSASAQSRTHYRVNGNLNLSRAIGDLEYEFFLTDRHYIHGITTTCAIMVTRRHINVHL